VKKQPTGWTPGRTLWWLRKRAKVIQVAFVRFFHRGEAQVIVEYMGDEYKVGRTELFESPEAAVSGGSQEPGEEHAD